MFSFGLDAADVRRIVWTFIFTFVSSFLAVATGWSTLPNMSDAKAAALSAAIAALAAVFSLIKNGALSNDSALK